MWWTHHMPEETKANLQHLTLPTLPLVAWREPAAEEGADALKVYEAHYHPSSTCLACHSGGLPWQDPDVQPAPIPHQVNNMDRVRRCDEWYGEEEGGACDHARAGLVLTMVIFQTKVSPTTVRSSELPMIFRWRSVPPAHSPRSSQWTCVEQTGGREHRPAPMRLAILRPIAVHTMHRRKATPFHLES